MMSRTINWTCPVEYLGYSSVAIPVVKAGLRVTRRKILDGERHFARFQSQLSMSLPVSTKVGFAGQRQPFRVALLVA